VTAPSPLLSVVLCPRGGAAGLRSTLEALSAQTLGREAFEVVLVDDRPENGIQAVARAFEPRLDLRWSRQREAGIASARNHGLFLARGGVVLFLDEEVADPDLLRRHLEAHRRFPEPRFAVLGRAVLDPSIADDPLMRFVHEAGAFAIADADPSAGEPLDWTHFRTGRSSCKRRFLLERGIFAAAFHLAGEDAELAYRLSRHGFEVAYEPGAVTRIVEASTVDDACARMRREGEALASFARLHRAPEVQAWTGAAAAAELWRELGPAYDSILRSARELDRIARAREEAGLPLDAFEKALVHRGYSTAFEASRAKGMIEGSGEAAAAPATPVHLRRAGNT
jgi:Glycosyltransferase like family 2